jgi:predicted transcriptional regulator
MIRNPIDIASRVSSNLSALIEDRVNKSELEQDITLATIHDFVAGLLSDAFTEAEERHHFDINESLLDELNALIEEFGESALAIDFVQENASEPLSRVIDAVVNDRDQENPPTLEAVKDAMISGLLASLVGAGVLDEDEDDVLLAEIDALIDRHGADALAEEFIRYE